MFEYIRTHQKLMLVFLIVLIAPAFVLLGVSGYSLSQDEKVLATVGDYKITQTIFDNEKRNQIEEMRRRSNGDNFDPAVFDTAESNSELLNVIVTDFLIRAEVDKNALTASNQAIQREIMNTPSFQEDGKFSLDRFERIVAARGYKEAQYDQLVNYQLAKALVFEPLVSHHFMSNTVSSLIDDTQLAGRKVRTKSFQVADYLPKVKVTQDQAKAYYTDNASQFMTLEQVDVEYIVLSQDDIREQLDVSQQDIESYYEQNKSRYGSQEQRQARHILISIDDEQSESEALEIAQNLKAQLTESPDKFVELAKEFSQDPGSAQEGGDLGLIKQNDMVQEFDAYVFNHAVNQISEPVQTAFGYHLIEVTKIIPSEIKPLEEVREEIVNEIQSQKLNLAMAEAQATFEEKVFEIADSFEEVANNLNLDIQTQTGVLKTPGLLEGPLGQSEVITELFTQESLENKINTKAVAVNDSLVSARVLEYRPPVLKSFESVESQITEQLKLQQAIELATEDAQTLSAKLSDAETDPETVLKDFSEQKTVSAINSGGLSEQAVSAIVKVKASDLPTTTTAKLGNEAIVLVWIQEMVPAKELKEQANPQIVQFYEQIITRTYNEALFLAAREVLADRHNLEVLKNFSDSQ